MSAETTAEATAQYQQNTAFATNNAYNVTSGNSPSPYNAGQPMMKQQQLQQQQPPLMVPTNASMYNGDMQMQPPQNQTNGYNGNIGPQQPNQQGYAPMMSLTPTMMPNYMQNLNANAMLGGMSSIQQNVTRMSDDQMFVDMENLKENVKEVKTNVINRTEDLLKDFQDIQKMTLLTRETADVIYFYWHILHTNPTKMIRWFCTLYHQKYKSLFEKYPSLNVYMCFVLFYLGTHSEEEFLSICKSSSNVSPSVTSASVKYKMFKRSSPTKRTTTEANDNEEKKDQPGSPESTNNNDESPKKKTKVMTNGTKQDDEKEKGAARDSDDLLPDHPLLQDPAYRSYHTLFDLGKLMSLCLPSEFAIFECIPKMMPIIRFLGKDRKISREGLRVQFNRPIVSVISTRKTDKQQYDYYNLEFFNTIETYIQDVTDLQMDINPITLMKLNTFNFESLSDNIKSTEKLNWNLKGYYVSFIRHIDNIRKKNETLDCRTVANPIFYIPEAMVDFTDISDVQDHINSMTDEMAEAQTKKLDAFYESKGLLFDDGE